MVDNHINEVKIRDIPALYLAISIVLLFNSGHYRATFNSSYIPLFALLLTTGYLLLKYQTIKIKTNIPFSVLIVGLLVSVIANFEVNNFLSFARVFCTALSVYLIICLVDVNLLLQTLVIMIKASLVISIVFYLIIPLFGDHFPLMKWGHYDLFVFTGVPGSSRLMGMFWEPGVQASVSIICFLIDYYILGNRMKLFDMILYSLSIILTQSAAGILIYFIALCGCMFKDSQKKRFKIMGLVLFAALVLAVVFRDGLKELLVKISPTIFGKLVNVNSTSHTTRFLIPKINFDTFLKRPIWGYGFTQSAAMIEEQMSDVRYVVAQTSTSTQFLAATGICGVAYSIGFLLPVFDQRILPQLCTEKKLVLAICMLLIVNKEPHVFITLTWLIFMICTTATEPAEQKKSPKPDSFLRSK